MSVADEFHVHIFPEDFPVHNANPENLRRLREAFPGRPVSIVVGSDVVAHASSYRKPMEPDSIHSFNHVIFRRAGADMVGDYGCISRKVLELTLPEELEEISSTRIREAVDANRDISNLIDPTVQEFIYRRGLYLREPQDKPVLRTEDLSFLPASPETAEKFLRTMLSVPTAAALRTQIESRGDDVMVTLDTHNDDYPTTQEGKNLPVPHCIAGTPGHRLFGETAACRQKQDMVFFKPSFGSMEMLCYLRTHPYQEIELVGVVTNICVISNAVL